MSSISKEKTSLQALDASLNAMRPNANISEFGAIRLYSLLGHLYGISTEAVAQSFSRSKLNVLKVPDRLEFAFELGINEVKGEGKFGMTTSDVSKLLIGMGIPSDTKAIKRELYRMGSLSIRKKEDVAKYMIVAMTAHYYSMSVTQAFVEIYHENLKEITMENFFAKIAELGAKK